MMKMVITDFDITSMGFHMIYQLTSDDDLTKFDIFYSSDIDTCIKEKVKIEFKLMEKRNYYRNLYKGQSKTFQTSTLYKIAVYYPRTDDNISDEKYSYPRAAVHTAIELFKEMFAHRMSSALGLSIGWGALIEENNLKQFLSYLTTDNKILPGVQDLHSGRLHIFCLVTISRARSHIYLDLNKAEAFIFILFNMINDIILHETKKNTESLKYTADTVSIYLQLETELNTKNLIVIKKIKSIYNHIYQVLFQLQVSRSDRFDRSYCIAPNYRNLHPMQIMRASCSLRARFICVLIRMRRRVVMRRDAEATGASDVTVENKAVTR